MSNHGAVCDPPVRPAGAPDPAAPGAARGSRPRRPQPPPLPPAVPWLLERMEGTPFAALVADVQRFRARPDPPREVDPCGHLRDALLDELTLLRHAADLLEVEFAQLAARFEEADLATEPERSPLFTLRTTCHMTGHAAGDAMCIGRRAASLPLSAAALEQGRIGLPHLALLARTSEALASTPAGFDEAALLDLAERQPLKRFRRSCAHARHAADRDAFLQDQLDDANTRWLEIKPVGNDAGYALRGFLDPVGGAAVHTLLDSLARPCGQADGRDRDHRLCDALVEVCAHTLDEGGVFTCAERGDGATPVGAGATTSTHPAAPGVAASAACEPLGDTVGAAPGRPAANLSVESLIPPGVLGALDLAAPRRGPWGGADAGELVSPLLWEAVEPRRPVALPPEPPAWVPADGAPTRHGPRRRHAPHLLVTATLDTLLERPHAPAGELEGVPVAAATVARLACSASVSRVLLGPDSAIVDVGRERRLPSPAVRRALALRDRGCVWPGCDRPARWTQPHHLRHWARGGSSDLGNLRLLCYRHHVKVHEEGWQLVLTDDRGVVAIPPPPDHPHAGAPRPAGDHPPRLW